MPETGSRQGASTVGTSPESTPARPSRWRQRLLGLVCLPVALGLLLHAPFVRDRVRQYAVAAARDRLGISLTLGSLDYNLLTLTFRLGKVSAAVARWPDAPFFSADAVTVGLRASTLAGHLAFSTIELVDPVLAFTRDAEGRYRLPERHGSRRGSTPAIHIDRLAISRLDLHIEGAPPLTIDARNVSASLTPTGGRIAGRLLAANGTRFTTPDGEAIDLGVDGTIGLTPDTVRIGPMTVTMPDSRVEVEGTLPFAPTSRLDLSYRGSVSLASAARFWPAIGRSRGTVSASGRYAGPFSDLVLTFDATSQSPVVRGIPLGVVSAQGQYANGVLTLSSAMIGAAGGRVTGQAAFGIRDDAASSASIAWTGVGLEALLRTLDARLPLPLSARLDGRAGFAWDHGGLPSLRVTASASAAGREATPGLPVAGRATLAARGAAWTLDVDHRLGEASTVAGRLAGGIDGDRFSRTTLTGHLVAVLDATDLAGAARQAPAVSPGVRRAASTARGTVSADLDLSGRLDAPVFATALAADALEVEGYGLVRMRATALVDGRGARLESASATVRGTTIDAHGTIPFDRRPLGLVVHADTPNMSPWVATVSPRWRPAGAVSVDVQVTGPLGAPRADGWASCPNLVLPFWSFGTVDGDVHLADGRLRFTARVPALRGTAAGVVALSSPVDLDISAHVEQADLARLGEIAQGLGAPARSWRGTTTVTARVSGIADAAHQVGVDIRADALDGAIEGRAVRLVGPSRVVLSASRLSVEGFRAAVGGSRVSIGGSLPAGAGERRLRVEADADVAEWWTRGRGQVHAVAEAAGSLVHPTWAGEATLTSGGAEWRGAPPLTDVSARVRLASDMVELVDAGGRWSGAPLTARGSMPLALLGKWLPESWLPEARPGAGLDLHASIASLDERALATLLPPQSVDKVRGRVQVAVDLHGRSFDLESLRGTAVIGVSGLNLVGIDVDQPKPMRLVLAGGRVEVADGAFAVGSRSLSLGGTVDVRGEVPRLDLGLQGSLDLALARTFVPVAVSGRAAVNVRLSGAASRPVVAGEATLENAALGIQDPRVSVSSVAGRLTFDRDRLTVDARGNVNGGSLELTGTLPVVPPAPGAAVPAGLRARGTSFLVEWPEGLRSSVDADVTYRIDATGSTLTGRVAVEPGAFRNARPPTFSRGSDDGGPRMPSRFDAVRLDLAIATHSPGLVDNSYARLEMDADVRVGGTIGSPSVSGRVMAREDGEVYLRGNVFTISRGVVEFDPDTHGTPSVDLMAETRRAGYDIRLRLMGPIDDLRSTLLSDPPLAEPDLMSLITTGSTSNSMSPGSRGGTSGQDALVAAISSDVLGLAGRSVGLDTVRIGQLELDLMSDNVDPEMRLTIGKSIGSWLDLMLSQNLRASGLTWAVTVRPTGTVAVRFVSRDAQTNSLEARHEVTFGSRGRPRPERRARRSTKDQPRVASVTVTGGGLPEADVLAATTVKVGRRFEFFEWQRDRERIEQVFRDRGYLQVQVSASRDSTAGNPPGVALRYQVRRGAASRMTVTGFDLPPGVLADMRAAWMRSVDDAFLEHDLADRARVALIDLGYFWPDVSATVTATADSREKRAVVRIVPGRHARRREVVLDGLDRWSAWRLRDDMVRSGAAARAWRDPDSLARWLGAYFRARGFAASQVTIRPIVLDGATARLPVEIREGPQNVVRRVDVVGAATAPTAADVRRWIGWDVGQPYDPATQAAAARRVEAGYVAAGYRWARASVVGTVAQDSSDVVALATVEPGARSVVGEVEVVGRGETRDFVVRHATNLPRGAPIGPEAIDRAQRRLYETEAFRSVNIQVAPVGVTTAVGQGAVRPPAAPLDAPAASGDVPMKVTVLLEEAPLYRLRYGVQLTDNLTTSKGLSDLRPGVAAELRRRNLFGTAVSAGVGGRYEENSWSVRGALTMPTSVLWPALSTLYVKHSGSVVDTDVGFRHDIVTALTYQDRWRLGQQSELSYGYTYSREEHRLEVQRPGSVLDGTATLRGNLFASIAWDRRDSVFNATRGFFHASTFEYGAPAVASDFSYGRYLLQQTYYQPVFRGVVLAGAARVGLLRANGDDEQTFGLRFRTGGAQTVRGYDEESLAASPYGLGGLAMIVLNGEVRFPIRRWLKGVAFLDAGNAFTDIRRMSLGGLKVGTGLGLRLDTPYALFRLDVGFPVPQGPGPLVRRWYFSIGQMF